MKKYSVKQIVKMEERHEKLVDKDSADYSAFMGTLSTCVFAMATIMASYATKDATAIETAIANFSALGFGIAGAGMFMDMITAHFRKGKLEKKLSEIYSQYGEDFANDVYDEKRRSAK